MTCPSCDHPNAPERNFCAACGAVLARYCPRCGFRNGATDRYCGGCGAAAENAAARAPVGEAPPPPEHADPAVADLLAAAREADIAAPERDVRVSQDDIDSLFGE